MARPNEDRLPPSLRTILNRLKGGAALCRQVPSTEAGKAKGGHEWFTYPDGHPVRSDLADGLVRLGLVETAGDGLFDGDGQTFRPVGYSHVHGR